MDKICLVSVFVQKFELDLHQCTIAKVILPHNCTEVLHHMYLL